MTLVHALLLSALVAQADPDAYKPELVPRQAFPAAAGAQADGADQKSESKTDADQPRDREPSAKQPDAASTPEPAAEASAEKRDDRRPSVDRRSEDGLSDDGPSHDGPTEAETPAAGRRQGSSLSSVPETRVKLRPPELLAEALSKAEQGNLKGEPLTLVDALARTADRTQKIAIAQTYWKLALAQANYFFARDQRARLKEAAKEHLDQPAVESASAAASAATREAELEVIQAQSDLAQQLGTPARLLLTVDRPHVGAYETRFEIIYASRAAPQRHRLIHRSLPVCRKAIDVHAAAVVASVDAWEAAAEEYRGGRIEFTTLATCLNRLGRERHALTEAVFRYNRDIADYAFSVPGSLQVPEVKLASLLITEPSRPAGQNGPTPAAPTRQPADEPNEGRPRTFQQPEQDGPAAPDVPGTPRTDDGLTGIQRAAGFKPAAFAPAASSDPPADDAGLYQGLVGIEPAARASKLTGLLHWDRNLPQDAGAPLALEDALAASSTADRRQLVREYWQARQRIAAYQSLLEQEQYLKTLAMAAVNLRDEPGGAAAMLRLQASRQAARGDVLDAQLALLDAQFRLANALGRPLEERWPLPTTAPIANAYTKAEPAKDALAARRIGIGHELVMDRSGAVVMADRARALASTDPRDWRHLDTAVTSVANQMGHTLAFLRALTAYNSAIADFALGKLPAGAPASTIMEELGQPTGATALRSVSARY